MERLVKIAAVCIVLSAIILLSNRIGVVEGQRRGRPARAAAVPGLKGGNDAFGPYDPVANWPRPMGEVFPTIRPGPGRSPPTFFPRVPIVSS